MHDEEIQISEDQVRQLVADQFPQWSSLPVRRVNHSGTDNALFRLGDSLLARMPRIEWARGQTETDAQWLPRLAAELPLQIPCPVAIGRAGDGYPWSWSVVPWINGSNPNAENVDLVAAAVTLGSFLRALHGIKTDPDFKGPENGRGCALEARDEITRNAIRELGNRVDKGRLEAAWQRALSAKPWPLAGVWVHGDLEPGNILADQGKIVAVIDFGMLGVGDPAVDLLPAWSLFDGTSRDHFRLATDCDDDIWERGKGWALTTALIALPYYWDRSEAIRSAALAKLEQVLA